MSTDNTAVETSQSAAADTEVQKNASSASEMQEDLLAVLEAKDAELAKVREERENYKKGMLKAKGKIEEDDDSEEDLDAKIERKLAEKLLSSKEAEILKEKDSLLKKALLRTKELETALKNRTQINSTGMGESSESSVKVSDNVLSPEQERTLRSKGWNDDKIARFKENLKKNTGQ